MRKPTHVFETKNGLVTDVEAIALFISEAFLLVTVMLSLFHAFSEEEMPNNIFICILISVLLPMPWVFERGFGVEMPTLLKVFFIMLMLCGPVLGKIYKFYYLIPHWDKLLHTSSGFLFAIIGSLIPMIMDKRKGEYSLALTITCAFCFTLSIAVVWEFFEYAMDRFFGMDMQQDAWIPSVNSYLLGEEKGSIGRISEVSSVIINGKELASEGYLDIGLIDTMNDMLVCALGGIIYCFCNILYSRRIKAVAWIKKLTPTIVARNSYAMHSEETISVGQVQCDCENSRYIE